MQKIRRRSLHMYSTGQLSVYNPISMPCTSASSPRLIYLWQVRIFIHLSYTLIVFGGMSLEHRFHSDYLLLQRRPHTYRRSKSFVFSNGRTRISTLSNILDKTLLFTINSKKNSSQTLGTFGYIV